MMGILSGASPLMVDVRGEAHVLGVPLELPVLRRDGSEVQCRFMVERAPVNPGRSVYMAWIEPLEPHDGR